MPETATHRHTLVANEVQRLAARFVKVDWGKSAAFKHLAEIMERGNE